MSDEGRAYVKQHSPYKGTTFWVHYVLGDMVNAQHDYEVFVGNQRLVSEWPISIRAVERAMSDLVASGHLEPLAKPAPGRLARYRFLFPEADDMAYPNGRQSDGRRQRPPKVSATSANLAGERPPKADPRLLLTETGTEGELKGATDPLLGFDAFWQTYPRRNGKRVGKAKCTTLWAKLSLEERRAAWRGARHYQQAIEAGNWPSAKDPERWLRDRCWEDWQTPAIPSPGGRALTAQSAAADRLFAQAQEERRGSG